MMTSVTPYLASIKGMMKASELSTNHFSPAAREMKTMSSRWGSVSPMRAGTWTERLRGKTPRSRRKRQPSERTSGVASAQYHQGGRCIISARSKG